MAVCLNKSAAPAVETSPSPFRGRRRRGRRRVYNRGSSNNGVSRRPPGRSCAPSPRRRVGLALALRVTAVRARPGDQRVPDRHGLAGAGDRRRGPDGNLWFTECRERSGASRRRARHRVSDPDARAHFRSEHRGRARRRRSGSPRHGGNKIGRITTDGAITEFPIPTRRQRPRRHHRRARRQPLVHRESAATRSAASRPAGVDHRVPASRPPAASRRRSPPGPTATSGSPRATATRSAASRTAGVITEFPMPTADSYPDGITAGPDGNLWFTERGEQDRPHHARAASSPSSRSRPRQPVCRHRRRARRRPLVHRARRQQDRPHHARRRHHRVPRPDSAAGPTASPPAPTATSGSPRLDGEPDRRRDASGRRRRSTTRCRSRRALPAARRRIRRQPVVRRMAATHRHA